MVCFVLKCCRVVHLLVWWFILSLIMHLICTWQLCLRKRQTIGWRYPHTCFAKEFLPHEMSLPLHTCFLCSYRLFWLFFLPRNSNCISSSSKCLSVLQLILAPKLLVAKVSLLCGNPTTDLGCIYNQPPPKFWSFKNVIFTPLDE